MQALGPELPALPCPPHGASPNGVHWDNADWPGQVPRTFIGCRSQTDELAGLARKGRSTTMTDDNDKLRQARAQKMFDLYEGANGQVFDLWPCEATQPSPNPQEDLVSARRPGPGQGRLGEYPLSTLPIFYGP